MKYAADQSGASFQRPASHDLSGDQLAALSRTRQAALRVFQEAGFEEIEPGTLLTAENVLDLYGEDVRARAFVFGGTETDLCLRPDLTLPICRHYMQTSEGEEARYVANGPVFRRPSEYEARSAQFEQIGCEWFCARDSASADAETYALTLRALQAAGLTNISVVTGDLGILFALIDAAPMPDRWRARLKRHAWRPERFKANLREMASASDDDLGRTAFLKALGALERRQARAAVEQMLSLSETTHVGLRSPDEIAGRFLEQAEDAQAHPLPGEIVTAIEQAATLKCAAGEVPLRIEALAGGLSLDITGALSRFTDRLAALNKIGIDAANLPFDAEFGRNLEYYDGFVFEFYDAARAERMGRRAAQLGGGGRYDSLLGAAASAFGVAPLTNASAVGAAIRPETALSVIGEQ